VRVGELGPLPEDREAWLVEGVAGPGAARERLEARTTASGWPVTVLTVVAGDERRVVLAFALDVYGAQVILRVRGGADERGFIDAILALPIRLHDREPVALEELYQA
jgi:hypothetical protein